MKYRKMMPKEAWEKHRSLPEAISYFEGDDLVAVESINDDRIIFAEKGTSNYVIVDRELIKFILGVRTMIMMPCEYCPLRVYGFCSRRLWVLNQGKRNQVIGCNWIDLIS